jgi:hypothetical protein
MEISGGSRHHCVKRARLPEIAQRLIRGQLRSRLRDRPASGPFEYRRVLPFAIARPRRMSRWSWMPNA